MKNIDKLKAIANLLNEGFDFDSKQVSKLVDKLNPIELVELFNYCERVGV